MALIAQVPGRCLLFHIRIGFMTLNVDGVYIKGTPHCISVWCAGLHSYWDVVYAIGKFCFHFQVGLLLHSIKNDLFVNRDDSLTG